jgi:hypothetical protein
VRSDARSAFSASDKHTAAGRGLVTRERGRRHGCATAYALVDEPSTRFVRGFYDYLYSDFNETIGRRATREIGSKVAKAAAIIRSMATPRNGGRVERRDVKHHG